MMPCVFPVLVAITVNALCRRPVVAFILHFGLTSGVMHADFILYCATDGARGSAGKFVLVSLVLGGLYTLAIGAVTGAFFWQYRDRRSNFRYRPGYCSGCGYSLRGNTSGRCPECGVAWTDSGYAEPTDFDASRIDRQLTDETNR